MKSLVYADKAAAIAVSEANIERVVGKMPSEMREKVAQNLTYVIDDVERIRGGHLLEIIFKN